MLELYLMGKMTIDEIEDKLGGKYNIELIDDIDSGKIHFSDFVKEETPKALMMEVGGPSGGTK